jgi:putative hydrolase of the HAD superfamily
MIKKPKWVIFDLGNVLYNFDKFCSDLAKNLNIDEGKLLEQVNNHLSHSMEGQMSDKEYFEKILKSLKLESKLESVYSLWVDNSYFVESTGKLMNDLHKAGFLIAILTNNWKGMTDNVSKVLSSYADIKFMFESAVEKISKPDKRLYEIVENRIKATGSEIYFIDDNPENLQTAKKMGWQTFLYSLGEDEGEKANGLIRKNLL